MKKKTNLFNDYTRYFLRNCSWELDFIHQDFSRKTKKKLLQDFQKYFFRGFSSRYLINMFLYKKSRYCKNFCFKDSTRNFVMSFTLSLQELRACQNIQQKSIPLKFTNGFSAWNSSSFFWPKIYPKILKIHKKNEYC